MVSPESTTSPRTGIAIVGAGQLARMLAGSAVQMGVTVRCLAGSPDEPAASVGQMTLGSHSDPEALRALVQGLAVLTFEHEWADLDALAQHISPEVAIRPALSTMVRIADKAVQRARLAELGIAGPAFAVCDTPGDVEALVRDVGTVVVKARKGGYDGYGVAMPSTTEETLAAWERFGRSAAVLEQRIDFVRELSVVVVRSARAGEPSRSYDVCESINANGRCEFVVAPARIDPGLAREARAVAAAAVDAFDGTGVFAVELFETKDRRLLVNELAPRVHNTGHWTIEGAHTSQFENHIRAVLGWPLGDTEMCWPVVAMANVLGSRKGDASTLDLATALAQSRVAVHLYGKREIRPGRKLGHVTAWGKDVEDVLARSRDAMRGLGA